MSRSPLDDVPSSSYETAWSSITELIHGDASWSGRERNVAFLNNGDGTFSDISGVTGLDFLEDGRSFATADLDGDGDSDLVLKSRNEPGIRLLRNDFARDGQDILNRSVTVRLRGRGSGRDAVGARVQLVTGAKARTKVVAAGSGFLSQRSKDLAFGMGQADGIDELRIAWPSGSEEVLSDLPSGQLLEVVEGTGMARAVSFPGSQEEPAASPPPASPDSARTLAGGIWLAEPVLAPAWELSDLLGSPHRSADYRGAPLLVNLWATWCPPCRSELRDFQDDLGRLRAAGLGLVAVSVDSVEDRSAVQELVQAERLEFPVLLAGPEFASAYSLLKQHLVNRRGDLRIPTTFLLDATGNVHKVYEGPLDPLQAIEDAAFLEEGLHGRLSRAVPFTGSWLGPTPRRSLSHLGGALLEHGLAVQAVPYLDQAVQQVPGGADGHYNLATALAAAGRLTAAEASFRHALELDAEFAEAHNGLGVVLARRGEQEAAIGEFRAAMAVRPAYSKAIGNLATAYQRTGRNGLAVGTLELAVDSFPLHVDLRNRLGLLHARLGNAVEAGATFTAVLEMAPGNPQALMNLALLDARRGALDAASRSLAELIEQRPEFEDSYVALARVQVTAGRTADARATLEALLDLSPRHGQATLLLEQLSGER